jgi:enoyl-CoA hydratase/carnithine racemase
MPESHDDDAVLWHAAGGVATITLNRPERMNAWSWPMQATFFEHVDRADDDPDVRAVVLTGSGRGFCPGMDMEWLSEVSKTAGDISERRPITALAELRKPLIAAINGACAGIGLVLALLSDVRFAAAGARISTSFTRRGLPAEFAASWFLPRLVGSGNAMDLLLSGRVINAEEALDLGLVNRVYPVEDLASAAFDYARDLAANCSPVAMAAIKAQVAADWHRTYDESFAEATALVAAPERRADFREGVDSYVEKRPPDFRPLPRRGEEFS